MTFLSQIAGAIESAWRTTAELLGCPVQGETGDMPTAQSGVVALGREYFSADQKRIGKKTDISSRRFKACVIPKHLNVQYVDIF